MITENAGNINNFRDLGNGFFKYDIKMSYLTFTSYFLKIRKT